MIGYMAKLLSLDAVATEKVAEASWQSDDGSIMQPSASPRQNLIFMRFNQPTTETKIKFDRLIMKKAFLITLASFATLGMALHKL